jgi:hypothetical protein
MIWQRFGSGGGISVLEEQHRNKMVKVIEIDHGIYINYEH